MLEDWRAERPDLELSPLSVIGRISRISRYFDREIAKTFRAYGLSSWGFYVLAALNRSGPPYELTPTQLYRSLLVTSGLMAVRIARLEHAGLVGRVPDPGDGRGVLVRLTPEGHRLVGVVLEEHNRREAEMLSPLTLRDREQVAGALRKLLVAAGDSPRASRSE